MCCVGKRAEQTKTSLPNTWTLSVSKVNHKTGRRSRRKFVHSKIVDVSANCIESSTVQICTVQKTASAPFPTTGYRSRSLFPMPRSFSSLSPLRHLFSPGHPSDTLGRRCLPYGYTRPTSTTTHARPLSRPMLLTRTQHTEFHDHSARAVGCQAPSSTQTHILGASNVHIHIHNICITSDERDEYTQEPGPTCCPRYLP